MAPRNPARPVVRELADELKVAAAGGPLESASERVAPVLDKIGEHFGRGPKPI
jgi:hypothetical protein